MRARLDANTLNRFKTIRELENFRPGPLTVLIAHVVTGKLDVRAAAERSAWKVRASKVY